MKSKHALATLTPMAPRADITSWLNSSRDYTEGLQLWHALKGQSSRKWLASTLENGPDPVTWDLLLEELLQMNGEKKEEPLPTLATPKPRRTLELSDHSQAPIQIMEARREFKEIMASINILRTEIRMSEGVKDKRWRAVRARKIVELTRTRKRLLDLFQVYDKTGEAPKEDTVILPRKEIQDMILDYKNAISYLGSWRTKKGKEHECAQRQARLDEINEFLSL
jgi:hypothetical protein